MFSSGCSDCSNRWCGDNLPRRSRRESWRCSCGIRSVSCCHQSGWKSNKGNISNCLHWSIQYQQGDVVTLSSYLIGFNITWEFENFVAYQDNWHYQLAPNANCSILTYKLLMGATNWECKINLETFLVMDPVPFPLLSNELMNTLIFLDELMNIRNIWLIS
jgi:hypothetical protein